MGAGFIGVDTTDDIIRMGKNVTLEEKLPNVWLPAFDKEFSIKVERILRENRVKLIKGIKEIYGSGKVKGVILEDGKKIEADPVILAMGFRPNVELAKKSGIKMGKAEL